MKIKELQKTVNIAWSPAPLNQLYLAAGTAAQQIDTSINSNATLELYEIDLADPGYDLNLKASQNSPYRCVLSICKCERERKMTENYILFALK